jgi:hypothetical protein
LGPDIDVGGGVPGANNGLLHPAVPGGDPGFWP